MWGVIYCGSYFPFSYRLMILIWLLGICMFFGDISIQVDGTLFNQVVCSFGCCCWVAGILYLLWILIIYHTCDFHMFSLCGLPSHFVSSVFWCINILNFEVVHFMCFSFVAYASGVLTKKSLPNTISWSFFCMFSF